MICVIISLNWSCYVLIALLEIYICRSTGSSISVNSVVGKSTVITGLAQNKTNFLSAPQMYLVIFPEGTRYNPEQSEVLLASQTFAAQQGKSSLIEEIVFKGNAFVDFLPG